MQKTEKKNWNMLTVKESNPTSPPKKNHRKEGKEVGADFKMSQKCSRDLKSKENHKNNNKKAILYSE